MQYSTKKRLIMLTLHYPYGRGESFVEDELKSASQYFDEIIIFSLEQDRTGEVRFLPNNARVVAARTKRFEKRIFISTMLKMLSLKTWEEIRFARRKLGCSNKKALKQIFIHYYIGKLLSRAFKREMLPQKTDVYYSYWLDGTAVFLTELKRKYPTLKCISRAHGGDCFIERGYIPFRRETLTYLDEIHSISEAGAQSIRKNLMPHVKKAHAKILVSRLGIKKGKEILNPPRDGSVYHIVTCSNIIQLKRLDIIISALASIHDLSIDWLHFGTGTLESQMKEQAEMALGNKRNISYRFAGYVEKHKILEYYETHHVDLFINSSDSEGIPVSIMEAMAYGIPVIARNVGGNSEIVNANNGILLPTEASSEAFCIAIQQILSLSKLAYERMQQSAFNTYSYYYNACTNYKKFWESIAYEHS